MTESAAGLEIHALYPTAQMYVRRWSENEIVVAPTYGPWLVLTEEQALVLHKRLGVTLADALRQG